MKKQLLTAIAVMGTLCGYAQTKGTNTIGAGISMSAEKTEAVYSGIGTGTARYTSDSYTLNYGYFIKDNSKLSINLLYGKSKQTLDNSETGYDINIFGGSLNYQKYYVLINKLHAFAGGEVGYSYSKNDYADQSMVYRTGRTYSAGASGGLAYFFSKRFAIETTLLSASGSYSWNREQGTDSNSGNSYKNTRKTFNLRNGGAFRDFGVTFYLMF
ncbi:MAG: hypothetical protein V4687_18000 [Bacteroidota bacterium]